MKGGPVGRSSTGDTAADDFAVEYSTAGSFNAGCSAGDDSLTDDAATDNSGADNTLEDDTVTGHLPADNAPALMQTMFCSQRPCCHLVWFCRQLSELRFGRRNGTRLRFRLADASVESVVSSVWCYRCCLQFA